MVQTISFTIKLLATCGEYSLWMIHRWAKVKAKRWNGEFIPIYKFRYRDTPMIQIFSEKKNTSLRFTANLFIKYTNAEVILII